MAALHGWFVVSDASGSCIHAAVKHVDAAVKYVMFGKWMDRKYQAPLGTVALTFERCCHHNPGHDGVDTKPQHTGVSQVCL